jgi:ribonucleoside-diphosphate reductase alpha chain
MLPDTDHPHQHYGPVVPACDAIHAEKYRAPGESFRDAMSRIATALSDGPEHYHTFRNILLNQRFLPGGRIQAAAGSTRGTTPYNCYVSATISDSFVDGQHSIMNCAIEAATTMRLGGGIGYDFSTLRPRGSEIKKLSSKSSGPISFMRIFNEVGLTTSSAGHRRGAQMGVLRIDHPDIEEFISAKQNSDQLTGFNLSVAITDEFMNAVTHDNEFVLRYQNATYRTIRARDLWEKLMRSTYDYSEPGVLFIDTINRMNNLYYTEKIAATNPCGEQPLPPYGACLLGSFNLVKYIELERTYKPFFDWRRFKADIPIVVRAMDNVINGAKYPLHEQEQEALTKRRMGLGVTGLANALETLGHPYGSEGFLALMTQIFATLRDEAYKASALLAKEKGAFPLFSTKEYIAGAFIQKLPTEVISLIGEYGIRNSHLLSIAPTGTISFSADNISSGIEPVFAHSVQRIIRDFDTNKIVEVEDYAFRTFGTLARTTDQVTIDEHLNVLDIASTYVDSAVSKTCNVPTNIPWEEFKSVYEIAWERGCKGCTTYRIGGKRKAILTAKPEANLACEINPDTGEKSCE